MAGAVRVFIACSLDGFIAGPDDDLSWLPAADASGEDYGYGAFIAETAAILMGRSTYDVAAGFAAWPYGALPVFVATSRPLDPLVETVVTDQRHAGGAARRRAGTHDGAVYLDGGALIRSFLDEGLVDELTVTIVNVILGAGRRCSRASADAPVALELTSATPYPSGLVQLRYVPEPPRAAAMPLFDPSEHEPIRPPPGWSAERAAGADRLARRRGRRRPTRRRPLGRRPVVLDGRRPGCCGRSTGSAHGWARRGLSSATDDSLSAAPGLMTGRRRGAPGLVPAGAVRGDRRPALDARRRQRPTTRRTSSSTARPGRCWRRCTSTRRRARRAGRRSAGTRRSAARELRPDPELGCRIWIQYRRGRLIRSIGAGHGFASNVRALLRGAALLDPGVVADVEAAAAETATRLAVREDGLANWPTAADPFWAADFPIRVQWCHGAPGLVTSLATPAPRRRLRRPARRGRRVRLAAPGRCARARASATAPRATAARSSPCTPAPATSAGSSAPAPSRCTRIEQVERRHPAPPSGPGRSGSRSTSAPASTAGMGCPPSTSSKGLARVGDLRRDLPDVAVGVGEARRPHAPRPVDRAVRAARTPRAASVRARRIRVLDPDRELEPRSRLAARDRRGPDQPGRLAHPQAGSRPCSRTRTRPSSRPRRSPTPRRPRS